MSKLRVNEIIPLNKNHIKVDTDLIISGIISANTVTYTNSTFNNSTFTNPTFSGSVVAGSFYGDGSNLTNMSVKNSIGKNSLTQVGDSLNSKNFGIGSSSLGDYNEANGDYSSAFGINNVAGSNSYYYLPSFNENYGIILDANAAKDFSTNQIAQSYSLTAYTTGTTVISSNTITHSSTTYISNLTGCTRYNLQNNKNEDFVVYYTDCETGLSANTILNAFSTKEVCSLTRPCSTYFRALDIKLFENGQMLTLGNDLLENRSINYALCQNYNVIQIYGLYGVFSDPVASARLDVFLHKLYSVGLLPVAIMGCGTAGFDLVYQWETTTGTCRFWGVNKECEFWNGQEPFATWINSINYISTTYPNRWNISAYIAGAGNWGLTEANQMIAANMDLIECTNYTSNLPNREPDPNNAQFLSNDLQYLATAAKNAGVVQDFVPLWSAENNFAGNYFGSYPPNLTVPINRYDIKYSNLSFTNKSSMCKVGFNMFRYEEIINHLPYSLCNISTTAITPTTSYAQLSGHTKIIEITPIGGCCNYIARTTTTATTIVTTIITGTTQILPQNNPNCLKYRVEGLDFGSIWNSRPIQVIYRDCQTNNVIRVNIYAGQEIEICSTIVPFSRRVNIYPYYRIGVKEEGLCCDCFQYSIKTPYTAGTPFHPIYLNYKPCGLVNSIDYALSFVDMNNIGTVCMKSIDYNSAHFYEILYYTPSGPVITLTDAFYLENNNICCGVSNTTIISSSTTIVNNVFSTTACTTTMTGSNSCSVYVIANSTFYNPSFSYVDCKNEYHFIDSLPNPFEEIRICSIVEPIIYLDHDKTDLLENIVVSNIGTINHYCVSFKFKKVSFYGKESNISWVDCYGKLQNDVLNNVGDELITSIILESQKYDSTVSGVIIGLTSEKNVSYKTESYSDSNTTTVKEDVYNNTKIYDEETDLTHFVNVIGIESGYSTDGTITILGDQMIYSGLTENTGYTVLEFKDKVPYVFSGKIVSTDFGYASIATGNGTQAKGNSSFSQNKGTIALGDYSHAEGLETTSNGDGSHSEGNLTLSNGDYSHAEGINTTTNGIGSHSEGFNTVANGNYSNVTGTNNITGGKEYDFFKIPDTNYLLILDGDVKNNFSLQNRTGRPGTVSCSGSTIISTIRSYSRSSVPYLNDCYRYTVSNTQTIMPLTISYTDCETNILRTTTSYRRGICSKTTPTYNISSQYSAFTGLIESGITISRVGKCCESLVTTTATTYTTRRITTTASTVNNIPLAFSGCIKYNITCNSPLGGTINYRSCAGTGTTSLFLVYRMNTNICSSIVPTWIGSNSLFTVTPMGNCCSYYDIKNISTNTVTWDVVDCSTGAVTHVTIPSGKEYGSCAAFPPNLPQELWFEAPGGEFCRTNAKIICTSYTSTDITRLVTTACSISTLTITGDCVTYRFLNRTQTTAADDNIFWTDCDGIVRREKLIGLGNYFDVCAIKNSAYANPGIDITQISSGCCIYVPSEIVNIHSFSGSGWCYANVCDGSKPYGTLLSVNGALYGTTFEGGVDSNIPIPHSVGVGTIFSCDTTGNNYEILHTFLDRNHIINPYYLSDGYRPYAGLFKASNGKLYGTTIEGINEPPTGVFSYSLSQGSIYSFDITTRTFTKLLSFYVGGPIDSGIEPYAKLMEPAADPGVLYGTTYKGNKVGDFQSYGTIYKYTISTNTIQYLHQFSGTTNTFMGIYSRFDDGVSPYTQLYEGLPGILYGTTDLGGHWGYGIIFKYDINTNTYTKIYDFDFTNGSRPAFYEWAERNGVLYGVTSEGGQNRVGTIFSIEPLNGDRFTKLYDFIGGVGSQYPKSLTFACGGLLYGTSDGGTNGCGTVFAFDVDNHIFYEIIRCTGQQNSQCHPLANIIPGVDGRLYGVSWAGGYRNLGTVFAFSCPQCTSGSTIHSVTEVVDQVYKLTNFYDVNAVSLNGTDKSYFDIISINNGVTNINGSIYEYDIDGLPPNTEYSLLEINPDVPFSIDSGKITSTYYGDSASAKGIGSQAKGVASHSEGFATLAENDFSHAEGYNTKSKGIGSHAEGYETVTMGNYSHSEGSHNESGSGFVLATFDGVSAFTIENKNLEFSFSSGYLHLISDQQKGKFPIINSQYDGINTTVTIFTYTPTGIILGITGNTYISPDVWSDKNVSFNRCHLPSGSYTGQINRHVWDTGKHVFVISNLTVDGVNYGSGSTLTINAPEDLLFGLGTDGNAYVTNITDWVNDLLPSGFMFLDDMKIFDRPIGSSFNLEIEYLKSPYGNYTYFYNSELGFSVTGVIYVEYSCTTVNSTEIPKDLVYFGDYSHSEGSHNKVFNVGSHAEGYANKIYGKYSHAEGYQNTALGDGSHAEGFNTISFGDFSHTEGYGTQAIGAHSHASGQFTIAHGDYSRAEGIVTQAIGTYSHAEGAATQAIGANSHASGTGTVATRINQYVCGEFNISGNTTSLFVVGNGTDDNNRSDVLQVDADKVKIYEVLNIVNIQEYADNSTAISYGLTTGDVYRTGEHLKIVY